MKTLVRACISCAFVVVFAGYVGASQDGIYSFISAGYSDNAITVGNGQKTMAGKIISLARNTLVLAQGYTRTFPDGKRMISFSKEYFEMAVRMYEESKFREALEYALASFNLSKAIIHAYLASHLGKLKY